MMDGLLERKEVVGRQAENVLWRFGIELLYIHDCGDCSLAGLNDGRERDGIVTWAEGCNRFDEERQRYFGPRR